MGDFDKTALQDETPAHIDRILSFLTSQREVLQMSYVEELARLLVALRDTLQSVGATALDRELAEYKARIPDLLEIVQLIDGGAQCFDLSDEAESLIQLAKYIARSSSMSDTICKVTFEVQYATHGPVSHGVPLSIVREGREAVIDYLHANIDHLPLVLVEEEQIYEGSYQICGEGSILVDIDGKEEEL